MSIGELLELEHRGWSSLCDGTGADFYGDLMTPDAVMVLAHGLVLNREAVIASLNDASRWQAYEISEERLVRIDYGSAVGLHRPRLPRGGRPLPRPDVERLHPTRGSLEAGALPTDPASVS